MSASGKSVAFLNLVKHWRALAAARNVLPVQHTLDSVTEIQAMFPPEADPAGPFFRRCAPLLTGSQRSLSKS